MPAAGAPTSDAKGSALQSFLLGGIAGSIAEMITMPAVVVRTRLMVQGASTAGEAVQYHGFLHACKTMMRNEGVGAFYKGAAMNAAFTPPARGMFVLGMDASKQLIGEVTFIETPPLSCST